MMDLSIEATPAEVQLKTLVIEIGRELEKQGITEEEDLDAFVEQAEEDAFRQIYSGRHSDRLEDTEKEDDNEMA